VPKFTIIEKVTEKRIVEAETAQDALDIYLANGSDHPAVENEFEAGVDERWVENEDGDVEDVEDS